MTSASTPDGTAVPRMTMRDRLRASIEPFGRMFGRIGLTPNALTLIGFAISVVAAWFASEQAWLAAGVLVIFGAGFDLLDGALARATGQATKFGAFLDSTMDRWGEAVVYVGLIIGLLAAGRSLPLILAGSAMASAFMVSYVRAKSESLGFTPGRGMASVGLAPREVRIVILTIGLIVAGLNPGPVDTDIPGGRLLPVWWFALVAALGLITILATLTTVQRIVHVYREARRQEQQ